MTSPGRETVLACSGGLPAILPAAGEEAVLNTRAEVVFLGLDNHGAIFAADLSPAVSKPAGSAATS